MPQPMIKQIHSLLIKKRKSVAVAESCTGGLISSLLTQAPGSSKYFILGIVSYSNQVKISLLKIPTRLLAQKGAVCRETAQKMAESARKLAKADFGIGITGIAGPSGATPRKPIGTVFIAIASRNKSTCKRFHFRGNRATIRKKSAFKTLELLKSKI